MNTAMAVGSVCCRVLLNGLVDSDMNVSPDAFAGTLIKLSMASVYLWVALLGYDPCGG